MLFADNRRKPDVVLTITALADSKTWAKYYKIIIKLIIIIFITRTACSRFQECGKTLASAKLNNTNNKYRWADARKVKYEE